MSHGLSAAVGAIVCTLGLSLGAQAQTNTPPAGRLLASNCFQCHGTNGKGPGFDKLAGKSSSEIYKDLKEFQSGKEGNGIMAKHALGYTDAQLLSLSSWLSTQR
jgi:cytochrome c553